jgi:ribonuclease HI
VTEELFTDGGCMGRNPSQLGGTWAWLLIRDGKLVQRDSGLLLPGDVGKPDVSNNLAELHAALEALAAVPEGWRGVLFTDSKVTLHRATNGKSFAGVPNAMRLRCLSLRRSRKHRVVLLSGHPTREDLRKGFSSRGYPVSKWNVACDQECSRIAEEFIRNSLSLT